MYRWCPQTNTLDLTLSHEQDVTHGPSQVFLKETFWVEQHSSSICTWRCLHMHCTHLPAQDMEVVRLVLGEGEGLYVTIERAVTTLRFPITVDLWILLNTPALVFLRSVPDPGADAVPRGLGLGQGAAVLRPRRRAVPRRPVLHGLGLLHRHGRHRAHLPVRRILRAGRDRNLQRQGAGGDWGGEEPHLPPLGVSSPLKRRGRGGGGPLNTGPGRRKQALLFVYH